MGIAGSLMQSICRDWGVALQSMDQCRAEAVFRRVPSLDGHKFFFVCHTVDSCLRRYVAIFDGHTMKEAAQRSPCHVRQVYSMFRTRDGQKRDFDAPD